MKWVDFVFVRVLVFSIKYSYHVFLFLVLVGLKLKIIPTKPYIHMKWVDLECGIWLCLIGDLSINGHVEEFLSSKNMRCFFYQVHSSPWAEAVLRPDPETEWRQQQGREGGASDNQTTLVLPTRPPKPA